MKRKFKSLLSLLLTVGLLGGLTSCSNDDDQGLNSGGKVEAGKKAYFSLSFSMPGTYANLPFDGSLEGGTPAESKINTVDVFVFTKIGDFINHTSLLGSDFTDQGIDPNNGQVYTSTKVIETKSGENSIYIAVNLPASVQTDILSKIGSIGRNALYKDQQLLAYSVADEAGSNFVMGSRYDDPSFVSVDIPVYDAANAAATTVSVQSNVVRSAVKFAVEKAQTVVIDVTNPTLAGTFAADPADNTNPLINFDLGNVNRSMYTAQAVSNTVLDPNFTLVVLDPNYSSDPADVGQGLYPIVRTGINTPTNITAFDRVASASNPSPLANNAIAHLYGLENTAPSNSYVGNVTYVALKTKFVPTNGVDANGSFGAIKETVTGNVRWFDNQAAYNTAVASLLSTEVALGWFQNGEVYYTVYAKRPGASKNLNVYRNDFFKLTISKINSLGDPNPGPKDPLSPLVDDAKITVNINVLPWNLLPFNVQLDGQ
ncbi:Mfa1 family fimbria major subunit [Dysgonomonas sp. HGC4]|uniref:Mfa1 family fimbria major subunit n=1 Tax=Dysgonomonas sp. HGC4 TaxID=1658009 RepID=UPI0006828407|nr:Mfa1 family fimbria major subunit [Dysgonomonas sp. HGC4]MBD8347788.1 Mfa1 fimbrilin C-terminal domain-containing protein [Dysgonomonas sp. HGC4]